MTRWISVLTLLAAITATGCSTSMPLFNGKDLSGWTEVGSDGAWSVEDGVLTCNGQKHAYAWLSTNERYADFELELKTRVVPGTNSGIFLRAPAREGRISMDGIEVQIKDDKDDPDFTDVGGSVFRRIPGSGIYTKPVGEWNHYRIRLVGRHLRIELNGKLVSDTPNINTVPPMEGDKPLSEVPEEGYIGLQNHGQVVSFKDIRIKIIE